MSNIVPGSMQALADRELLNMIADIQDKIRDHHNKVSEEPTNKNHVKQKAGMDYVEFSYMKNRANEHFPGWSFKNIKIIHEFLMSGWVVVQGELHFIDQGMPRVGAIAAAHRIAFKSGATRTPENIVDLGNDVKSAVSDAMKKGFNVYMNISDDIYRQLEIEDLTKEMKDILYGMIENCDGKDQAKFYNYVDRISTIQFENTAKRIAKIAFKSMESKVGKDKAIEYIEALDERFISEFNFTIK